MNLRDELLGLKPGASQEVPLPGGKTAYVHALSIQGAEAVAKLIVTYGEQYGNAAAIVCGATRDKDGNRVFEDSDIARVAAMPGYVGSAIVAAYNRLNDGSQAVAEGNQTAQ